MGWSYHKSKQVLPGVRLNLSRRGGLGVSFGVKGARVAMNKQGVRTSVGSHGLYYRKQAGWNSGQRTRPITENELMQSPDDLKQYNLAVWNATEKKAVKWFVIAIIAGLLISAVTKMEVWTWIFTILACVVFIPFTISGVRHLWKANKAGKIITKE